MFTLAFKNTALLKDKNYSPFWGELCETEDPGNKDKLFQSKAHERVLHFIVSEAGDQTRV